MSKKLRDLKHKTRSAAKGGRNGQIFERFANAHNARVTAGVQSPRREFEERGAAFAEGFREGIRKATS